MSGRCGGLHCPGCGDGGGARLIALVAAAAIAAAVIRAIWHTLIEAAEIAAIVIAGAAGAAAAAGAGYAAVRIRRLVLQARQDRRRGLGAAPIVQLPREEGTPMSIVIDPLGRYRCARCANAYAYAYDQDAEAMRQRDDAGHAGFICKFCARYAIATWRGAYTEEDQ